MKKKNKLKLSVKKEVISNLHSKSIKGGAQQAIDASINPTSYFDWWTECNSAQGCGGGPDETMTCWAWSCYVCDL